ncbi:MAG: nitroreductase family protein, partial [Chloroflexota bacterium]
MDVGEAIAALRVIRNFQDRPLDEVDLASILHAGRRASSSKNKQRWTFITVMDRERLRQLSTVGPYAGHLAGAAVAVALVTPDPHQPGTSPSVMWDLGLASQNMILEAWGRGIGSCPATVYDADRVRTILGYPADQGCPFILSFGYPADPTDLTRPLKPGGRRRL